MSLKDPVPVQVLFCPCTAPGSTYWIATKCAAHYHHRVKWPLDQFLGQSQIEPPTGEKPRWNSPVSNQSHVHAVSLRCLPCAASRIPRQRWSASGYTHEWCEIPTKPLAGPCLCVLPPPEMRKIQEDRILILLINRKVRVKPKFLLSQPCLSLIYMHTYTHTRMQTQSYSVLHVSCSLAAGVWRQGAPLCWTPPLLHRLWSPLLGKHWLCRARWQPASQLLHPHRQDTNFFNQNASALASWSHSVYFPVSSVL